MHIIAFNQPLPFQPVPPWRAGHWQGGSKPGAGAFLKAFLPCPFPTGVCPKLVITSLKFDSKCVYLEQGSRKTLMASKLTGEANISTSPFWVFSQLIEVSRWAWLSLCRQISNDPQRHPPSPLPPPIPCPVPACSGWRQGGSGWGGSCFLLNTTNTLASTKGWGCPCVSVARSEWLASPHFRYLFCRL